MPNEIDFKPGDRVIMVNCLEAKRHAEEIFTVISNPTMIGGTECVWLEGWRSCFDCNHLKEVPDAKKDSRILRVV